MTKQEAIEVLYYKGFTFCNFERCVDFYSALDCEKCNEAIEMAIKALEQESIKFYYVESLDDYWVGRRLDNFYYATWHGRLGFIWSHSKYLPWGEHIVDENTLWKEHTYPSEPKEIPFTEWIVGFTKKYFHQEPKSGEWIPIIEGNEFGEPYQSGIYCSECGETLGCEANFCPNCGAKMRSDIK